MVQYAPALFTGNVTNNVVGGFKVTQTHYTVLGTFTGTIDSDPAEGHFTDLKMRAQDYLVGGM